MNALIVLVKRWLQVFYGVYEYLQQRLKNDN